MGLLVLLQRLPALIVPRITPAPLAADPDRYKPPASVTIADFAGHYGTPVLLAQGGIDWCGGPVAIT